MTNWCGHRKTDKQRRENEKWEWRQKGQKERARELWHYPALLLIHLYIRSEDHSASRVTVLTVRAREQFRSLTACEWRSSGKKRGRKLRIKTPTWKIELCGKARVEKGVFTCRWIKHHFIWGSVSWLYDKCNPFISHSREADPLPSIILYSVDV